MYQSILLAADGSEHSVRAAQHAAHLAKGSGEANINVVYVIDPEESKSDVLHHWNQMDINEKRLEKLVPIEVKLQEAGVKYEVNILRGDPGPTLVQYGNDKRFDLVVIGSRGLNALQELVLGSVSHKVAKSMDCPVLIVK